MFDHVTSSLSATMKRMFQVLLAILTSLLLMSCTALRLAGNASVKSSSKGVVDQNTDSDAEQIISIGDLPAQTLRSGQCGLFLFTPFPSPRFVFFAESSTSSAKIIINGQEIALRLDSTDGTLMEQHYTDSVFSSNDQSTISVSIDEFERTDIGIRIETGLINVKDSEGWSVTVPVSGTTACYDQDS